MPQDPAAPDDLQAELDAFEAGLANIERGIQPPAETPPIASASEPGSLQQPPPQDVEPGPVPPEPAPAAAPAAQPAPSPTTEPPAPPAAGDPWNQRFTLDGETKTRREWAQDPRFSAILTRAEQAPHFQEKYEELRRATQRPPEPPVASPPAAEVTPAALAQISERRVAERLPNLKTLGAAGVFEKDFVDDYPKVAAFIDEQVEVGAKVAAVVDRIERAFSTAWEQAQQRTIEAKFAQALDSADPELQHQAIREEFLEWLTNDEVFGGMDISKLGPAYVQRAFQAFKGTRRPSPPPRPQPAPNAATQASGEAPGGRRGPGRELTDDEKFEQEMIRTGLVR